MICDEYPCDQCIHMRKDLLDGWNPACDAYPNGIPSHVILQTDVTKLKECRNGIKYEPK